MSWKKAYAITGNCCCTILGKRVCTQLLRLSIFSSSWIFRTRGHESQQLPNNWKRLIFDHLKKTRKTTGCLLLVNCNSLWHYLNFVLFTCVYWFSVLNNKSNENPLQIYKQARTKQFIVKSQRIERKMHVCMLYACLPKKKIREKKCFSIMLG